MISIYPPLPSCIRVRNDLVIEAEGMMLLGLLIGRNPLVGDTEPGSHLLERSARRIHSDVRSSLRIRYALPSGAGFIYWETALVGMRMAPLRLTQLVEVEAL